MADSLYFKGDITLMLSWIMNRVCIRIAQKMGLYGDGELLGLSPFETEMRRRV
jgi:hypothetical protein